MQREVHVDLRVMRVNCADGAFLLQEKVEQLVEQIWRGGFAFNAVDHDFVHGHALSGKPVSALRPELADVLEEDVDPFLQAILQKAVDLSS